MRQWLQKGVWALAMMMVGLSSCQSEPADRLTTTPVQAAQLYGLSGTEAMGNAKGAVTLVVISSYECQYCRKDYPVIKAFVASHPDVKLIYKSYLAFGLDTLVEPQYAALAAAKQHRFAAMHDALLTTHQALNNDTIMQIAGSLKLNKTQFVKDMHSQAIADQIVTNTDLIDQLGIEGIPTVIMASSQAIKNPALPQYIQVGFIRADRLQAMYQAVR